MGTYAHFFINDSYLEALEIQKKFHAIVKENPTDMYLLGFEHSACITMGRNSRSENILNSSLQIPIYQTERGGEVTVHEPGQLVIYPILNVMHHKLGAKLYIHKLEQCIIESLKNFNVHADTIKKHPGVWIEFERKIAAIGIRIKEKVSMHGIAINIANTLETFSHIVPCGIHGKTVTTLNREAKLNIHILDFWKIFLVNFEAIFSTKLIIKDLEKELKISDAE